MDIYELIDISSSSEEDGEITRSSTPLPKDNGKYPRIIVEILNSSAEATADEEEFLHLEYIWIQWISPLIRWKPNVRR